jgi:hypothetical protein
VGDDAEELVSSDCCCTNASDGTREGDGVEEGVLRAERFGLLESWREDRRFPKE